MKKTIRLTERELRGMISESVKNVLNEIYYSQMPLGDYNERNAWFKQQADADFPNHGVKDSNDWQQTYGELMKKQKVLDKEQKKIDKQNAKKQALQQKFDKLREKISLYEKALSWAIEGSDEDLGDYDAMLTHFPIVINLGIGQKQKIRAEINGITETGYSGIMKFDGQKHDIYLNGCQIWVDDECKVQVSLDNIKAKGRDGQETIKSYMFDVIGTIAAMKSSFTKKVRENAKYIMNLNTEEDAAMTVDESKIRKIVKRVLEGKMNEIERSFPNAIPGDEDIYYPCDINPDVWDALQRGDFGHDDEPDEAVSNIVAESIRRVLKQKR